MASAKLMNLNSLPTKAGGDQEGSGEEVLVDSGNVAKGSLVQGDSKIAT